MTPNLEAGAVSSDATENSELKKAEEPAGESQVTVVNAEQLTAETKEDRTQPLTLDNDADGEIKKVDAAADEIKEVDGVADETKKVDAAADEIKKVDGVAGVDDEIVGPNDVKVVVEDDKALTQNTEGVAGADTELSIAEQVSRNTAEGVPPSRCSSKHSPVHFSICEIAMFFSCHPFMCVVSYALSAPASLSFVDVASFQCRSWRRHIGKNNPEISPYSRISSKFHPGKKNQCIQSEGTHFSMLFLSSGEEGHGHILQGLII